MNCSDLGALNGYTAANFSNTGYQYQFANQCVLCSGVALVDDVVDIFCFYGPNWIYIGYRMGTLH